MARLEHTIGHNVAGMGNTLAAITGAEAIQMVAGNPISIQGASGIILGGLSYLTLYGLARFESNVAQGPQNANPPGGRPNSQGILDLAGIFRNKHGFIDPAAGALAPTARGAEIARYFVPPLLAYAAHQLGTPEDMGSHLRDLIPTLIASGILGANIRLTRPYDMIAPTPPPPPPPPAVAPPPPPAVARFTENQTKAQHLRGWPGVIIGGLLALPLVGGASQVAANFALDHFSPANAANSAAGGLPPAPGAVPPVPGTAAPSANTPVSMGPLPTVPDSRYPRPMVSPWATNTRIPTPTATSTPDASVVLSQPATPSLVAPNAPLTDTP